MRHLLTECQQKLSSNLREHLTDEEYDAFKAQLDGAMKLVEDKGATVEAAAITARYDDIKEKLRRYETRQVEYKKQPNVILLIVDALKVSPTSLYSLALSSFPNPFFLSLTLCPSLSIYLSISPSICLSLSVCLSVCPLHLALNCSFASI